MAPKTKSKKTVVKSVSATGLLGEASGRLGQSESEPGKKVGRKPNKALVLVHGAGKFPKSHVEAIAADIKATYGKPIDTFVAYYADWDQQLVASVAVESIEAQDFKQAFRAELQKQSDALAPLAHPVTATIVPSQDDVGGLELASVLTNQIASYLFNPVVTHIIQAPLLQVLDQVSNYKEIILISHSMGTVVAFDVLKQVADQYPITLWITLGCPLGKLRRVGVRDDHLGKITEQVVENWYNVFDNTDIVADPISPAFPEPGYRIHDIFVEVANKMPEAHDYFNNPETMRWIVQAINN
jgi:hypothetical protein